jgi:YbbR domain-containing protein
VPSNKIWNHLSTAVLALVLALFVWLIANYEQERPRVDRFGSAIPIQVGGLPEGYVVVNKTATQIEVDIRAFASSWDTLSPDNFVATADWSDLTEGVNIVPVEVICTDRSVTIEDIRPDSMIVQVERLISREIDVNIDVTDRDELPLGYDAMAPSIEPISVNISGAHSVVAAVASLDGSISLANQRTTFEERVRIRPLDAEGRAVENVKIEPAEVTVRVVVQKRENFREVAVRARTAGVPERGYFVSSVSVSPSTVTVFGPPDIIDTVGSVVDAAGEIDTTGATRSFADRVQLALPEGVQVYGAPADQPFEVTVSIGIDAVIGGTTVELPVRISGLAEGFTAGLSVPVVDVLLTGPAAILDALQINLLDAIVDVSALGEGTHQVRPKVNKIAGPDSLLQQLTVKEVQPEYIQVTLSRPVTPTPSPTPTLAPTITPTPANTAPRTPTPTRTPTN